MTWSFGATPYSHLISQIISDIATAYTAKFLGWPIECGHLLIKKLIGRHLRSSKIRWVWPLVVFWWFVCDLGITSAFPFLTVSQSGLMFKKTL